MYLPQPQWPHSRHSHKLSVTWQLLQRRHATTLCCVSTLCCCCWSSGGGGGSMIESMDSKRHTRHRSECRLRYCPRAISFAPSILDSELFRRRRHIEQMGRRVSLPLLLLDIAVLSLKSLELLLIVNVFTKRTWCKTITTHGGASLRIGRCRLL